MVEQALRPECVAVERHRQFYHPEGVAEWKKWKSFHLGQHAGGGVMPASVVNISMNSCGLKGRMIETTVAQSVVVLPRRRDVARPVGSHQQSPMAFVAEYRDLEAGRAARIWRHRLWVHARQQVGAPLAERKFGDACCRQFQLRKSPMPFAFNPPPSGRL